jgi:VWFA-related protein
MRTPNGIAVTAFVLVLLGGAQIRGQQAPPGQVAVFRTRVDAVSMDVGVVDRQGRPIPGLAASDFTVTVNGRPRRIVTAEFVDVASARAGAARSAAPSVVSSNDGAGVGRSIVFVVDQDTLEPGQSRHVLQSASRLFDGLSFVDRSALVSLPIGPQVEFTWAHDRVQDALRRAMGKSTSASASEFASLSEARDIANRNPGALQNVVARECGARSAGAFGGDSIGSTAGFPGAQGSAGGSSPEPPGGGGTGSGGVDGGAQGGGTAGSTGVRARPSGGFSGFGGTGDSCTRDLMTRAEWTWRSAVSTSQMSVSAMRQALSALARVPGDKTVILVSGGWPLDERDEHTMMSQVATEAAAARATIYSLYVPALPGAITRRTPTSTPVEDSWIPARPLQNLASMTGGGWFDVVAGADPAFERISRELGGYYRLGVEKEVGDDEGKGRRMKVAVARSGASVRARDLFDVPTFEDRNWPARMAAALHGPRVATGIRLRVTSYLAAEPGGGSLKAVITGEASRVEPGEASVQLLVQDSKGNQVISDERPIGEPINEGLAFSTSLPLAPGSYIVRVAMMDGMGRTGSVDHHVDARAEPLGDFSATGPILVRVPTTPGVQPRFALSEARQDERLAMELQLRGEPDRLADARVVFEIAASADSPALIETDASASSQSAGWMSAQAVADLRVLPPGDYVTRVRVESAGRPVGQLHRALAVTAHAPVGGDGLTTTAELGAANAPLEPRRALLAVPPRFTAADALAPPVLGPLLDRVAARPEASAPSVRALVDRARSSGVDGLTVSGELAADEPVAAFLEGLTLLRGNQLDPAANAFRAALRAAPDFYPAMVYLGACFAAGGNDKEAAGAWQTALIKEGETRAVHVLLVDALLRQLEGAAALRTVDAALARWPADEELKRRFVLAALLDGRYADGLQALDGLIESHADDELTLMAGLLVLYESTNAGTPVNGVEDDRARMTRLAGAYRAAGGQSVALVDSWLEAAHRR